jgi:guanylate kinase
MKQYKKQFVALASPSGGGKTTLCKMLLKKYSDTCLSISYTTRAPRGGEKQGIDYHFVTHEEFHRLIRNNELVEWAEVHGKFYGTSKVYLEKQSKLGKIVLLDIDVQGVDSLKNIFGDRCLSIFILPPSLQELEQRLRARNTESEEKLQERLKNASYEMSRAKDFDLQLINSDLDKTFSELSKAFEQEVGIHE